MFSLKKLNIKAEKIFIYNKGNTILYNGVNEKHNCIYIKQKSSNQSTNNSIQKFEIETPFGVIYILLLSNEMIIISGRKFIQIFKKDENNNYKLHQDLFCENWAEVTKMKELTYAKDQFAACGWHGFLIFQKENDNYVKSFDLDIKQYQERWIIDFMEIKNKPRGFVLCGSNNIFIIDNYKILNKFTFEEKFHKSFWRNDCICQYKDDIFYISGSKYITSFNTSENTFNQFYLFDEDKFQKKPKFDLLDSSTIYKFDNKSIILFTQRNIVIIQILDDEKIQVNYQIDHGDTFIPFYFIEDEKTIYLSVYKNKQYFSCKFIFNK